MILLIFHFSCIKTLRKPLKKKMAIMFVIFFVIFTNSIQEFWAQIGLTKSCGMCLFEIIPIHSSGTSGIYTLGQKWLHCMYLYIYIYNYVSEIEHKAYLSQMIKTVYLYIFIYYVSEIQHKACLSQVIKPVSSIIFRFFIFIFIYQYHHIYKSSHI